MIETDSTGRSLYDLNDDVELSHRELQLTYYNENCRFTPHTDGPQSGILCSMILYLNENWKKEWEGNLELWGGVPWKKEIEVEPIFNRAVIFSIEDAPHGHPIPLNTPDDVSRYSLALYYFTDEEVKDKHSVIFYEDKDLGIKETDNLYKF